MISETYKLLNILHAEANPSWARGGARHAPVVRALIDQHGLSVVLDYGAGRGTLGNVLMGRDKQGPPHPGIVKWIDYEPARPECAALYTGDVDLIVCTHVLEHVEPEHLQATLEEMRALQPFVLYIAVPHKPSGSPPLSDGRNCHLIVQRREWWTHTLKKAFPEFSLEMLPQSFVVDGSPRDETRYILERRKNDSR